MRTKNKKFITLEEDINKIWKQHGWKVVKEKVGREGNLDYWKIYAKRKEEKKIQFGGNNE